MSVLLYVCVYDDDSVRLPAGSINLPLQDDQLLLWRLCNLSTQAKYCLGLRGSTLLFLSHKWPPTQSLTSTPSSWAFSFLNVTAPLPFLLGGVVQFQRIWLNESNLQHTSPSVPSILAWVVRYCYLVAKYTPTKQ